MYKCRCKIKSSSRKPALGAPRSPAEAVDSEYSPAATAVARLFVEITQNALHSDPMLSMEELRERTSLSQEDVSDAIYELRGMVEEDYGCVVPLPEVFVTFENTSKSGTPRG